MAAERRRPPRIYVYIRIRTSPRVIKCGHKVAAPTLNDTYEAKCSQSLEKCTARQNVKWHSAVCTGLTYCTIILVGSSLDCWPTCRTKCLVHGRLCISMAMRYLWAVSKWPQRCTSMDMGPLELPRLRKKGAFCSQFEATTATAVVRQLVPHFLLVLYNHLPSLSPFFFCFFIISSRKFFLSHSPSSVEGHLEGECLKSRAPLTLGLPLLAAASC